MTGAPESSSATLILADSTPEAQTSISPGTSLLGLPLLRRAALAAFRAGFDRVYVLGSDAQRDLSLLEGTLASPFPRELAESSLPAGRIVLLSNRIAAEPRGLRSLRLTPAEPERLHRIDAGAIVETREPRRLVGSLTRQSLLPSILSDWAAVLPEASSPFGADSPAEVTSPSELAAAETTLLRSLVKEEDGFLARHVNRRISLAVTRRLAGTNVSPNAMTAVSVGLGLWAAGCFLSPVLPRQIAGGILFLLHSILDGCDGELARLKFQESRLGGTLDFWGDNLVHAAVFSAFAVAWSTASRQAWPLALGALAVLGTLLSAGFVYVQVMRPKKADGPLFTSVARSQPSRLSQVTDVLARRDFIYLVLLLGVFGKAYWFLALAAVGTPTFFLVLLAVAFDRRQLRQAS